MCPGAENQISQQLALCADPQGAQILLERILKALPGDSASALGSNKTAIQSLISLCAGSPPLARNLAGDPPSVERLFLQGDASQTKERAAIDAELAYRLRGTATVAELHKGIRRYRHMAMARIAVRDLLGLASLDEIVGDLSDLAEAILQQVCTWCFRNLTEKHGPPAGLDDAMGFAVIGMGKLGGHELNFCSDVDIMYLYQTPPGGHEMTAGGSLPPLHFHEFYTRLAEMTTDALHRATEDGIAFRVDLNLRPGGKESPIVHSLEAAEIYYTVHGETWHRLSLIKAAYAAGDKGVAESFLKMIRPFVYRRYLDYGSLEEIRWLKRRVESAAAQERGRDVKRGRGGIRELEFLVQALQLINGGRFPEIRDLNTLGALKKLGDMGFLDPATETQLEESYRFFRRLEHRIQMAQMRQTHRLPDDEEASSRLARSLGFATADELRHAFQKQCEYVHEQFSHLLEERDISREEQRLAERLLEGTMEETEAMNALSAMGFCNVSAAMEVVKSMAETQALSRAPARSRRLLKELAPPLLHHAAAAPDPDMAIVNLGRWVHRVGHRWGIHALLAENPSAIHQLTTLFGSSNFLSRMFIEHPQLMDQLILHKGASIGKTRYEMEEALSRELKAEGDPEEKLAILRRFQNEQTVRLGMHYVFGELSEPQVSLHLTRLAEACIGRSLSLAYEQVASGMGDAAETSAPFVVVGMGRLGSEELNFNSDLDLLFVYNAPDTNPSAGGEASEYFARLAQRFISLLSASTPQGLGYRVDMRLRPSGRVGPLVVSLDNFMNYYRNEARLWERQALIRARVVAGHSGLGEDLTREVHRVTYETPLPSDAAHEIKRLRHRMEIELARETDDRLNLKTGLGGLVDVEFSVQYLQLVHGNERPRVREPNTLNALKALGEEGILSESDLHILMSGYEYLRRVETHLRIIHDFSAEELRFDTEAAEKIARGLGYRATPDGSAASAMRQEYERITRTIRRIYSQILA